MAAGVSDDSGQGHASPARTQKNDGAGIGEMLRAARERRGLTLEQIARETKIPLRHLDALEHDNLAAVPGPFYQRAEIRTYARALKLDPNLVLARLERGPATPGAPATAPSSSTVHQPERSRYPVPLLAAGVVLTALVLWRTMPRPAALDGSTQVGRTADSIPPTPPPSEETDTREGAGIGRADVDQTSQASPLSERVAPAAIQAPEGRSAIEAQGELPLIAKTTDERPAAGVATELVVVTEPAGARVTVDGIGWGVTPVTIRHLSPGSKRVRVSKDGYATTERVVSIVEGQRKTTDIPLSNQP